MLKRFIYSLTLTDWFLKLLHIIVFSYRQHANQVCLLKMPPEVDSGFVKTDLVILPKIYMFMVLEYFTPNSKYAAPEIRGVEATLLVKFKN